VAVSSQQRRNQLLCQQTSSSSSSKAVVQVAVAVATLRGTLWQPSCQQHHCPRWQQVRQQPKQLLRLLGQQQDKGMQA
jgi:hypothetical protein